MHKQKPILFLQDKLADMLRRNSKYSLATLGSAAGLLLLASALTLSVVSGVQQTAPPAIKPETAQTQTALNPVAEGKPAKPTNVEPAKLPAEQPKMTAEPSAKAGVKSPVPETSRQPVKGELFIAYGWQQHPLYKEWRFHNGVDILSAEGESVSAVWAGEVQEISQDKTAGLTVTVVSGEYAVSYGSLATVSVQRGEKILAGAKVGTVGSSKAEAYPHLHLSIRKSDKYIDPSEKLAL